MNNQKHNLSKLESIVWTAIVRHYPANTTFYTDAYIRPAFVDNGLMTEGSFNGTLDRLKNKGYLSNTTVMNAFGHARYKEWCRV